MSGAGVERASEEARDDEVPEGVGADQLDEGDVEEDLGGKVERDPARRGLVPDEAWAEGVEEDLEGAAGVEVRGKWGGEWWDERKEGFAENVAEDDELDLGRHVGVHSVFREELGDSSAQLIRILSRGNAPCDARCDTS